MKWGKWLPIIMVALVLMATLSGCMVIPLAKYYNIPTEDVESVQFYDLREETIYSHDFTQRHSPSYTLPEQDIPSFLYHFSKVKFSKIILIIPAAVDPSFHYGELVVRINFSDGKFTLYSCNGYGQTFDAKGKSISTTHYSCKEKDLLELISLYYPVD